MSTVTRRCGHSATTTGATLCALPGHRCFPSVRLHSLTPTYFLNRASFVFDSFVTMITCGRTRLVDAVVKILERISTDAVSVCIYERKREHFPRQQPTTFADDARILAKHLPGSALRFGADHEHAIYLFHTTREHCPDPDDVTMEVLMHGISKEKAELFRNKSGPAQPSLAEVLGLTRLLQARGSKRPNPQSSMSTCLNRPATHSTVCLAPAT